MCHSTFASLCSDWLQDMDHLDMKVQDMKSMKMDIRYTCSMAYLPPSQLGKLKSSPSGHLTESSNLNRSSRCQTVSSRPGPNNCDGVGLSNVALVLPFKSTLLQNCLLGTLGKAHLGKAGRCLGHLKMVMKLVTDVMLTTLIVDHDKGD